MHITTTNQPALALGFGNYTCNWGTHFCGLYETEAERDEIIMGFLAQGAQAEDLQFYAPAERTIEDFKSAFSKHCPLCGQYLADSNTMLIQSAKDLYYPGGTFSPWTMEDALNDIFEESQMHGKRNVRATAEMAWALEAIPGVDHLMAYESRLNYFITGKPWISICLYNVTKFDGKTIMQVLQTHPFTISQGVITANPFFQDPDLWLAKNAPEFLRRDE
ncbi:MEDS domain-containing protein [Desulfovibrio sp. JY]|nr:MEDS domain-containing protein [Desulfovibrio sp. JY]